MKKDTMEASLRREGRKRIEYDIQVDGKWEKRTASRETVASQAMWALAMKGNIQAFRAIYEILNEKSERKLNIQASFSNPGAVLRLEADPDRRRELFEGIVAAARKRQEATFKDATPIEPEDALDEPEAE